MQPQQRRQHLNKLRRELENLPPPPKPKLINRKTDPKHMPMDFTTPVAEIARRYEDELDRCNRWAHKRIKTYTTDFEKDISEPIRKYISRNDLKLVGYVPWQSQTTGDKWIAFMLRRMTIDGPVYYSRSMYYWETVGGFGFAFGREIPRADDVGAVNHSIWMFNNHCIQRFKERTGVTGNTIDMMLFIFAVMEYSVGYRYDRCGRDQYEIATEFGVFRTTYQDKHFADHIHTFIAKETLEPQDRARYDHFWRIAKKKIFTNNQIMQRL